MAVLCGERVEGSRFERYIACGGMVGDGGFTPQGGINFDSTPPTAKKTAPPDGETVFWWGMVDSPLKGCKLRLHAPTAKKTAPPNGETVFLVGDGGFTPQGGVNFDSTIIQPKNKSKRQKSFGFIWWGMVDLPLKGYKLRLHDPHSKKTAPPNGETVFLVGDGGFEPPKASPADLQSVPFGHSGNPPYI